MIFNQKAFFFEQIEKNFLLEDFYKVKNLNDSDAKRKFQKFLKFHLTVVGIFIGKKRGQLVGKA